MGYTMHEMNVILFSKEDAVFGDNMYSDNDNYDSDTSDTTGDGTGSYNPLNYSDE